MSFPAMTFGDRFRFSRKGRIGGGRWVHPKGADSVAVSGLCFGNALVGSGWATAVLLCTNGLRKQSSHSAQCLFLAGNHFFSLGEWLPVGAMTIASSLMGGCGLSHEHVEDGCKSTCVKFGGLKPDRTGDMISSIHV